MVTTRERLRADLRIIASWIQPGSRVLDLGCGRGELLAALTREKQIQGVGIERDEEKAAAGISRGLTILHEDFNDDALPYAAGSFDFCILSQTLQQVYKPRPLIIHLLEISSRVIVSFPNFSHWRVRLQLLLTGRAPKNEHLPYEWYDTPNIRVITLRDFRSFAHQIGARILQEAALNSGRNRRFGSLVRLAPDWRATYGIFLLEKGP